MVFAASSGHVVRSMRLIFSIVFRLPSAKSALSNDSIELMISFTKQPYFYGDEKRKNAGAVKLADLMRPNYRSFDL